MKTKNKILIATLTTLLSACNGFFDKDNTPPPAKLVAYNPEVRIQSQWQTNAGSGVGSSYLKFIPAINDSMVFTANHNGVVTAINRNNGKILWQSNTGVTLTGGPGIGNDSVIVGSRNGDVIALNQSTGVILWKTKVPSEVLASPAIANNIVLIKTIDGKLSALSTQDGHSLWNYQQTEPALILRGSSS
ncbi:MAG TPA: PQQ-binding-like beta-propeller repeat protein, partial [Candidatus Babeliaceae bacterium]|nr:PQQ-binding-like beta-propeller repeat protein [Candidatus Babeliaceae bacterium]